MAETFDTKMKQLEALVDQLDDPELGIERSVELYLKGKKLAQDCEKQLEKIKGKVTVLDIKDQANEEGEA